MRPKKLSRNQSATLAQLTKTLIHTAAHMAAHSTAACTSMHEAYAWPSMHNYRKNYHSQYIEKHTANERAHGARNTHAKQNAHQRSASLMRVGALASTLQAIWAIWAIWARCADV